MKNNNLRFAMIGSGRVAHHIAPALVRSGMSCVGVYSPTYANAVSLSQKIGTVAIRSLKDLVGMDLDFVLLSIKDDALHSVASEFPSNYPHPLLHTSGSTPLSVLNRVQHYGVLYPMQTFSKQREVEIEKVPFFIEFSDEEVEKLLRTIMTQIRAEIVQPLSSENRVRLHLASVFACNFTNHLYAIADEVLGEIGLDFNILKPLVEETLSKALTKHPKEVQTGPALRGDQKTIDRHLALLYNRPEYQHVYELLSQSIDELHKNS